MNIVSHEEEKFREIERRHMYNSKAMIPQPMDAISTNSMMFENRPGATQNGFDDVTSIKTEQFKLSTRDHNMLENHLFS